MRAGPGSPQPSAVPGPGRSRRSSGQPGRGGVPGSGEVAGAEGGAPDAVEVVLRPAQVQGQGLAEQAEAGQGLLQAVDRAGGWLEDLVQVVGGGVVRGTLG